MNVSEDNQIRLRSYIVSGSKTRSWCIDGAQGGYWVYTTVYYSTRTVYVQLPTRHCCYNVRDANHAELLVLKRNGGSRPWPVVFCWSFEFPGCRSLATHTVTTPKYVLEPPVNGAVRRMERMDLPCSLHMKHLRGCCNEFAAVVGLSSPSTCAVCTDSLGNRRYNRAVARFYHGGSMRVVHTPRYSTQP